MTIFIVAAAFLLFEVWLFVLGSSYFEKSRSDQADRSIEWAGVSILKPLHEMSPNLRENLQSFLRLKSRGKIEIIFLIQDAESEVFAFLEKVLRSEKTEHTIVILAGLPARGRNAKNSLLQYGFEAAKHPWIYVSESSASVAGGHVEELLKMSQNDADTFVTTMPLLTKLWGLPALLLGVEKNLEGIQNFAESGLKNRPIVFPGSVFFHRGLAQRSEVFQKCLDLMTEKWAMPFYFQRAGARGRLLTEPLHVAVGLWSFQDFYRESLSSAILMRSFSPLPYFLMPLRWGWQIFFIYALLTFSLPILKIAGILLVLRIARFSIYLRYLNPSRNEGIFQMLALPIYDLLSPCLWFGALITRKVFFEGRWVNFDARGAIQ